MDIRGIRLSAREALDGASCDHKKLITIYTLASVLLTALLALLDMALDQAIEGTSGLAGLSTRSMLQTLQQMLSIGQMVFILFWEMGFIHISLCISRRQSVAQSGLLEGFRKFWPVVKLDLMLSVMYLGIILIASYVAAAVFVFTPWAEPMMEMVEAATEEQMLAAMEACIVPLTLIICAVLLVVGLPFWYRLRMAQYALMDDPKAGARAAIRKSRQMMKGNRIQLFKLDLSFWWFYVLQVVISVIAYLDVILALAGVNLPWGDTVSYFLALALYGAAYVMLYRWRGMEVQVSYAKAYEALLPPEEPVQRPVIEQ